MPDKAAGEIILPQVGVEEPITIAAPQAARWRSGAYDVWQIRGGCRIRQGALIAQARDAVLWVEPGDDTRPTKIIAYLEGEVTLTHHRNEGSAESNRPDQFRDRLWFGRFYCWSLPQFRTPPPTGRPPDDGGLFQRAHQRFEADAPPHDQRGVVQPFGSAESAQTNPPAAGWLPPANPSPQQSSSNSAESGLRESARSERQVQFEEELPGSGFLDTVPRGARRIRAFPRSDVRVQAQWFPSPGRQQWIAVISSGVNLLIDGTLDGRTLDISADRMVIWTAGAQADLSGQTLQSDDTPLELYMEGNIEFREGERLVRADQMYYDVTRKVGIILDADVLTPVPRFQGLLRLKARIVRQLDQDRYAAEDALVTTSRLADPSYHFGSRSILLEDTQRPAIDPLTGAPQFDPATGQPVIDHDVLATSRNNILYVGGVPVLYWPTIATDLRDPSFYIDSVTVKDDNIFGSQLLLSLDGYELLGIREPPAGTDWKLDLDPMTERGIGHGTNFRYSRSELFGLNGPTRGIIDAWGIDEQGLDNLGRGRRALDPEVDYRGRVLLNHRQFLRDGWQVTGEVGLISDRDFLEQYYEREWDTEKDRNTGIELKRTLDTQSFSVTSDVRLNDFFTQTQWLPRGDHFWLGKSLLGDRFTWFEHTSVGYGRYQTLTAPEDPANLARFSRLPWELDSGGSPFFDRQGERFVTRQEIDLPLELGPMSVVPFALGELAHWGEDIDGDDIQRAFVQTGVRAALPFWTVHPHAENELLNVHGLAHKVVLDAEFSYADASRDVDQLPLYDPLDDDAQEAFRRMFTVDTFGGMVPPEFDPRLFAIRAGQGGNVTSPVPEIADDMLRLKLGVRQRWQTKRGRPGERRIIDWMILDAHATYFPRDDRDNFGQPLGMLDYNFQWHLGDRVTLLSDGYADLFQDPMGRDGLRTASVGTFLNRPSRLGLYLGFRTLEGPINSNLVQTSLQYRMTHKWLTSYSASIDISDSENVGHRLSLTRIGESLLVRAGFVINESKDTFGVNLMIEPRFLPTARLGRVGGLRLPPAGAMGLE